jgi:hypothetical protein
MLVKMLENKWVIRLFGISLIIAPFVNMLLSTADLSPTHEVQLSLMKSVFAYSDAFSRLFYPLSLVIGVITLRGSRMAWRFLLGYLGLFIIYQFMHITVEFKKSPTAAVFLGVNICVFAFISDQLLWKKEFITLVENTSPGIPVVRTPLAPAVAPLTEPVTQSAPPPAPSTAPRKRARKISVHLEGFGTWGRLIEISHTQMHVRGLTSVPAQVAGSEIELSIPQSLPLRLRLSRQTGNDFFFSYVNLTAAQVYALNRWLAR